MSKSNLKKHLKQLNKADLEKEILKMYDRFKEVKQYYELDLSGDTTKILEEYKKKMDKEYFPTRGFGKARSSVSRKIITDFKKISIFQKDVIELILHRVENMLNFTQSYGDIDEAFYTTMENSYQEACELICKEKLEEEFQPFCKELLDGTSDFGWGLHDTFCDIYGEHFKD